MHNLSSHLTPSASTLALVGASGRRVDALQARMERPGSVGEMLAAASALSAQGARFYAEVETTVEARLSGVQAAWICSSPQVVQAMEAAEECFLPGRGEGEYVTREHAFGDDRDIYYWTFERVSRAWLVTVEWFNGPRP